MLASGRSGDIGKWEPAVWWHGSDLVSTPWRDGQSSSGRQRRADAINGNGECIIRGEQPRQKDNVRVFVDAGREQPDVCGCSLSLPLTRRFLL